MIVTTVPLKGYVLIDPTTEKGKRLRDKWDVADKPNRHVVCYTFVRACIIAGRRLSNAEMVGATPFFLHQYVPVEIFLHNSITESAASALSIDIEASFMFIRFDPILFYLPFILYRNMEG